MQSSFESLQAAVASFFKFTPKEMVANSLKSKTEAGLGVCEFEATMFFSDIVGFTQISERVEPKKLIMCMEEYFEAVSEIVEGLQGTIGDYIGDAVFAFFNVPHHVGEYHALYCIESALKQQEALKALRKRWKKRNLPEFFVRMGINTGMCLAGNVGSKSRLKYTLIGDAVNLASRLEALGKFYDTVVTISNASFQQPGVADAFCVRVLDVVAVVGKSQSTIVMEVMARRSEASSIQLNLEMLSFQMIENYLGRQFEPCFNILTEMDHLFPGNTAILKLMDRVAGLRHSTLPPDWDGTIRLSHK